MTGGRNSAFREVFLVRTIFVCWALTMVALHAQQPSSSSGGSPALSYDFFKTKVQPIFLAKRGGHARCIAIKQAQIAVCSCIVEFLVQFTRAFKLRFHLADQL